MTIHFLGGSGGEVKTGTREGWGGGWLKRCCHKIRRGSYFMMMLNYKGGRGVKNLEESDYVISECS